MPLKTQQKNIIQILQQYSERILNKPQNLNQIFFQVDSSKFGGRVINLPFTCLNLLFLFEIIEFQLFRREL